LLVQRGTLNKYIIRHMRNKGKIALIATGIMILSNMNFLFAQSFATDQYKKAVWMTARMYGGQRSGDGPNWLIMDHTVSAADQTILTSAKGMVVSKIQLGKCFTGDADGTYSLSGGWVDCGDHVKFGQTMFYAGYMLSLAYSEFPEGYDDLYTWNYSDYKAGGDYSWEGKRGIPNGIPDILDELKYETDFFIKCAKDATTFYSQVGMGGPDHLNWITSVAMAALPKAQGGQTDGSRDYVKNPKDCVMPAMCAATLASMSRLYKIFDPVYAATCLQHARYAYAYAVSQKGLTTADASGGTYYPAKSNWEDSYAIMLAEMYRATGTASYKTEALTYAALLHNHNWTLCYNNCDDLAAYLLATFGDATAKALLKTLNDGYIKDANTDKVFMRGPSWGALRYTASQAFSAALQSKLNNETAVNPYTLATVDFIMGKNSKSLSFIVGFGTNYAKRPHHRNYYACDDIMADKNATPVPTKNAQFGYLVGGAKDPASYNDKTEDYQSTEGGIDYNAGIVAALGAVVSKLAPVNISKFGHPTPDLGDTLSICGVTSLTLNSKIATDGMKTFTWIKDGTTVVAKSTTANTYSVTAAGTYECILDSTGWSTSDKMLVVADLPKVSLGANVTLCDPATVNLDAYVSGAAISYSWKKNGTVIAGATSKTYTVYTAGTYICAISASGCATKSDTVVVTSSLPTVISDTVCTAGTVNLGVSTAGTYEWYNVATGGTALATGSTYSPSITVTTTYYVKDASSFSGSVGPTTRMTTGSDWGVNANNQLKFTVGSTFTLQSFKVNYGTIYANNASATITIEILTSSGTAFTPAKTITSNARSVTTAMSNTLIEFTFTGAVIDKTWGPDLRMRVSSHSANGGLVFNTSGATYPYNSTPSGVVTFTGTAGGDNDANDYMYFYDWKVFAGSTCARTPVQAVVNTNCNTDVQQDIALDAGWNLISFAVNPSNTAVSSVFSSLGSDLLCVKTMDAFYDPSQTAAYNSLKNVEPGKAYLVNVKIAKSFSITGPATGAVSLSLNPGWNMVGYPRTIDNTVATVLSNIWSQFYSIKNFSGFYIKGGSLNSITNLQPGSGYFIKTSTAVTLNY